MKQNGVALAVTDSGVVSVCPVQKGIHFPRQSEWNFSRWLFIVPQTQAETLLMLIDVNFSTETHLFSFLFETKAQTSTISF